MSKTLVDAIGCWTMNPRTNNLLKCAYWVLNTTYACRRRTLENDAVALLDELRVLSKRLDTMQEGARDAIKRCHEIIDTNELAA